MYELKKKIGKVFASKFVGTGPSSYEKRIYRAAVSQRLRNTDLNLTRGKEYPAVNRTVISSILCCMKVRPYPAARNKIMDYLLGIY